MASCAAGGAADNVTSCEAAAASTAPAVKVCGQATVSCEYLPNACATEHRGLFSRLCGRIGLFSCRETREGRRRAYATVSCCCRERLSLRQRLARLLHRKCRCCCCCPCGCNDRCKVVEVIPVKAPEPAKPAPLPPPTPKPTVRPVALTPPPTQEIHRAYLPRIGNDPEYRWVTGQLFYIHAESGLWVVRYAPVDREDRYGGSVVLAPAVSMDSFQEGDLVTVHGEMLNE